MAIVTVTFEDFEDSTKVNIKSDPPFTEDNNELTPAQIMAIETVRLATEHECDENCEHD